MDRPSRISISGELEGDYVVLAQRGNGSLLIAPAPTGGVPVVVALEQTCSACPSQWEGELEDGRSLYARYRGGGLSVGVGDGIDAAVSNSWSEDALYFEHVGDGLDGYMDFDQLHAHLHGLLDFPEDLEVKNEREPSWDLEAFEKLFAAKESADPDPARESDKCEGALETSERAGTGLREAEIQDWTCFSCGRKLTQAHEGDYFHDDDSTCFDPIPVPTSLVEPSLQDKASSGAGGRD